MLTQMRALSQNWFGRTILGIVLALIIASFAIWGIGDRFSGYNANQLAKVGDGSISVEQYRSAYQTELSRLQQQQKRGITNDEARRMGVDRQVLSRLLTDTILDQQAHKLGLAVGNDEISREIMADESFKGQNGSFDQARFDMLLRDNGYNEASYAAAQRRLILRQDVSVAVVGALELPKIMTDAIHRYQAEVRDVDFFVLPPAAAGKIATPSEADLKAYYDGHASAYVAPEFRKLVELSVVPVNLVKPDAVSQDDVKARYEQMKPARFEQPEKRTIAQLVFPTPAAADAASAKVKGGTTFDALVAAEKKSSGDVSLGTIGKADLADKAVADAAFALPEGGTSAPVKGQFGTILLHVSKIYPGKTQPLMEVDAQLKDEVAIVRAKQEATKLAEKVEDARTAGKTLTEAATEAGLKPRGIDAIDAQGRGRNGKPIEGLVAGPQFLKAAFATDMGADTEVIRTKDGGDVWFEVAGIDPSHPLPFAEVKSKVEAAWRADETARRLAAEGDKIVAAIDGGRTLAAAAADAKAQVLKATDIGRGGGPDLSQNDASAFFEHPVGKAGSVTVGARGRIVYKILAARVPPVEPNNPDFKKLMGQVKNGFEDDVTAQYLARVQSEIGVSLNQPALQTALGGDAGS